MPRCASVTVSYFFFFQAEDGIRDWSVTGVQTCALPISEAKRILNETAEDLAFGLSHVVHLFHPEVIVLGGGLSLVGEPLRAAVEGALRRSEERRVGKECR